MMNIWALDHPWRENFRMMRTFCLYSQVRLKIEIWTKILTPMFLKFRELKMILQIILKYKSDENVSDETRQILLDLFGNDACVRKAGMSIGIVLDKTQSNILSQSWRISVPDKLTAYKEACKSSFPVHFLFMKRRKICSKFLLYMTLLNYF